MMKSLMAQNFLLFWFHGIIFFCSLVPIYFLFNNLISSILIEFCSFFLHYFPSFHHLCNNSLDFFNSSTLKISFILVFINLASSEEIIIKHRLPAKTPFFPGWKSIEWGSFFIEIKYIGFEKFLKQSVSIFEAVTWEFMKFRWSFLC